LTKRDNLEMKKDLFEEFRVSLQLLQSSLAPLKLISTFKAKQVEVSRLDSNISYKGVLNATVNADAVINVYDLEVLKLATSQTNRSNQITGNLKGLSIFTASSSSYFYITAGGRKTRIDVSSDDTLQSLAEKINTKLKTGGASVGVTAAVPDDQLILKSDNTGLGTLKKTATLKRSANSWDTLTAWDDEGTTVADLTAGKLVIKAGSTEYKQGVDFDVVAGNRIRWREFTNEIPPAGAVYQDEYTAYVNDTYKRTATRSATGDLDVGVLPFTPLPQSGTGTGMEGVVITSNGGSITYVNGTDFKVNPDGSVHW
jgi:hypothetical protein